MQIKLKAFVKRLLPAVLISLNLWSFSAQANNTVADTVLYIDPVFYQHQSRMLHPYYNYWFSQGSTVESVAVPALQANGKSIGLCEAGQLAKQVISLSPSIFYNPQLRVYYSTIKAHVYAGDGTLLGEYQGEGQQQGYHSVDIGLEMHMKAAYDAAMQNLMQSIKLHQDKVANSDVTLPCQIIGAQTKPNYFN